MTLASEVTPSMGIVILLAYVAIGALFAVYYAWYHGTLETSDDDYLAIVGFAWPMFCVVLLIHVGIKTLRSVIGKGRPGVRV